MRYAFGSIILFVTVFFGLAWVVKGNNFFMYKFFAPKEEAVRRQVFEETKSYNDGMAQELDAARLNYFRAKTDDERQAIGSVVLHQFAGYDTSKLTGNERSFLDKLQQAQIGDSQ